MSKYKIDDSQVALDGKKRFIVQYAEGGNVPPQYEFDSLGGAQSRLDELERSDKSLTEKDYEVIAQAIEARTKWLDSPDESARKKLLSTFSRRYEAIGYQPSRDNPDRRQALLRWQQSMLAGLPQDHQKQFHEYTSSKGLER